MARLMVIGDVAQVEILTDPEDEELMLAKCEAHAKFSGTMVLPACEYTERFDTTDDAQAAAEQHADGVR